MATQSQILSAQQFGVWCGIPLAMDGISGLHTERWVRQFQDAYQYGDYARDPLTVDGDPGPATMAAMKQSFYSGLAAAANFTWPEFLTKGSRAPTAHNHVLRVTREQLAALQRLRNTKGRPLYLLSTYRDPAHNAKIGGATRSQHLYGAAADLDRAANGYRITEAEAERAGFRGIGMVSRSDPAVVHVDTRPNRARWYYT